MRSTPGKEFYSGDGIPRSQPQDICVDSTGGLSELTCIELLTAERAGRSMRGGLRRLADRPIPRMRQAFGGFSEDAHLRSACSKCRAVTI